jgi:hypothetical protein
MRGWVGPRTRRAAYKKFKYTNQSTSEHKVMLSSCSLFELHSFLNAITPHMLAFHLWPQEHAHCGRGWPLGCHESYTIPYASWQWTSPSQLTQMLTHLTRTTGRWLVQILAQKPPTLPEVYCFPHSLWTSDRILSQVKSWCSRLHSSP